MSESEENGLIEHKLIVKGVLITYIARQDRVMSVRAESFNPKVEGMYMQYRIGDEQEVFEDKVHPNNIDFDLRSIINDVINRGLLSHQELFDIFDVELAGS